MAIAIDASTPARFEASGTTATTSASFTAPSGAVLLVGVIGANAASHTVTITDSGGLTWTQRIAQTPYLGHGWVYAASAVTASSAARTVTATSSVSMAGISAYCWVITGADTASPVGSTNTATASTNVLTASYTSSANNSRGFGFGPEWAELGTPTSTDTIDQASDFTGNYAELFIHKAADTATSGTTVNFNFDAAGAGAAEWIGGVVEIKPAAGAAATSILVRRRGQWRNTLLRR